MIYLYTGTPGSGKSYHATRAIDRALKRGMNVIANYKIVLNPKKHKGIFMFVNTYDFNVKMLVDFAKEHHKPKQESQTIIVIDEASILFNSRDGLNRKRMEWIKFFATHRHLGFDVILITQMDRSLDRQVRGLIEMEYKHRNLMSYGWKGLLMMVLFRKRFVAVEYWYPIGEKSGSEFFNINKKIANLYDTFGSFDDEIDKSASSGSMLEEFQQKLKEQKNEKKNNGVSSSDDNKPVVVFESSDTTA